MIYVSAEYEFVYCLFNYVLRKRGLHPHHLSSFFDEKYSFSISFCEQIGRTVLLLSNVFHDTLSKYFRRIFPQVLRSRKVFMAFLNSLVIGDELEGNEYLLEQLAILTIVTELGIFSYQRGYENVIPLTAECLIEFLVARSDDFDGWMHFKISSIPFSRAYCVLLSLIEKDSPKLQTDKLALVLDLVENAFDASTCDILQKEYGIYPLFPPILEDEDSVALTGYTDPYESETCLSGITLVIEESAKGNSGLRSNDQLIIKESDCTVNCKDERSASREMDNCIIDKKLETLLLTTNVPSCEKGNKMECFSAQEFDERALELMDFKQEFEFDYSQYENTGPFPTLFSNDPSTFNDNLDRLLENLNLASLTKNNEHPFDPELRDEKEIICHTEECRSECQEVEHSEASRIGYQEVELSEEGRIEDHEVKQSEKREAEYQEVKYSEERGIEDQEVEHLEESEISDQEVEHSVPLFYGIPQWKRRILQLRQERKERKFNKKHICKDEKCKNLEKVFSTNLVQDISRPVTTTPGYEKVVWDEQTPTSNELDLQKCDAIKQRIFSTNTPLEDEEIYQIIQSFKTCETRNSQCNNICPESTFLPVQNGEVLKSLSNTKNPMLQTDKRNRLVLLYFKKQESGKSSMNL